MENLFSSCLALVALWCADKRLLSAVARWKRTVVFLPLSGHTVVSSFVIALSVVVSCATDLMTSHAWLKCKFHPHRIARVRDTFAKLGSGAMGSRFREQLTHWTDPAGFTQPDQWKGFLSAMVTAHEADLLYMRNF